MVRLTFPIRENVLMNRNPSDSVHSSKITPSTQLALSARPKESEPTPQHDKQHVLIESEESGVTLDLPELWRYRELLYFLTWRDVKIRYKQTLLGAAWAIIQPLLTMLIFTLFFGQLAGVPSDGIPYPIFVYCALLPWQLFAHALAESSNSIV